MVISNLFRTFAIPNKTTMKNKRNKIIKELEKLVHNRYSFVQLDIILSKLFEVDNIEVSEEDAEDETLNADYCVSFEITKPNIGGVFDLYYLPLKNVGVNGEEVYITEVGYMFDM